MSRVSSPISSSSTSADRVTGSTTVSTTLDPASPPMPVIPVCLQTYIPGVYSTYAGKLAAGSFLKIFLRSSDPSRYVDDAFSHAPQGCTNDVYMCIRLMLR